VIRNQGHCWNGIPEFDGRYKKLIRKSCCWYS
jgi:hypothetical protein